MLVKSEKKLEESGEIRSNERFPTVWQRRDSEVAVNDIIMTFMDMVCFNEIKFEYRGGFVNNFGRMKIESVDIFPAVFSNPPLALITLFCLHYFLVLAKNLTKLW